MAPSNKLQQLLTDISGRVRIAHRSLTLAIRVGAFALLESDAQLSANFWSGRIDGQTPQGERIAGTPGGMVWRYIVAIASWEGLLLRVTQLLGPQAHDIVAQLAVPDDTDDASDLDATLTVVADAVRSPGFAAFAMTRFADYELVNDLVTKARGTGISLESSPYSSTVDFITDLLVQESELADLVRLSEVLNTNECQSPETASLAIHLAREGTSASQKNTLEALVISLAERRGAIRVAVLEALQSNMVLDGLVANRLQPYAESRFVIGGTQPSSMSRSATPLWILHRDYDMRVRGVERLQFEMLRSDKHVLEFVRAIAVALTRASVPFLYWCAKSDLDVRRLWQHVGGDESGLWPWSRSSGYRTQCVAFASKVDGRSFARAINYLVKARTENPRATCVLVTDHWNEERAAAIVQETTGVQIASPIAVLHSDGPRYPVTAFLFPNA